VSSTKAAIFELVVSWDMKDVMIALLPSILFTLISASHMKPQRAGASHAPCPTPNIGYG
jgi:hypothetical protein